MDRVASRKTWLESIVYVSLLNTSITSPKCDAKLRKRDGYECLSALDTNLRSTSIIWEGSVSDPLDYSWGEGWDKQYRLWEP